MASSRGHVPDAIDLSKLGRQAPPPDVEPYPSEIPKIKATLEQLQSQWLQKRVSDPADAAEHFNQQAVNLFGEIGFKVAVEWLEAEKNPFAEGVPLYVPQVAIVGRVRDEGETDHDRLQDDIVKGLADGKKGWVDPNTGQLREDRKKKLIT